MNQSLRPLLALVIAVLLAAGCSSGNDTTEATESDGDASSSSPELTTEETEPSDDETDDDEPSSDDTLEEPPALTASFRGVTEEVIKIGVVTIDFDRLAAAGVDQNRGDTAAVYTAAVEAINDRGGINGRQLEITSESYLPIGSTEADEVCTRLTEDLEVFVVVGVIRLDNVLCYTELHETAVVAINQQNQDRLDRAKAPYATVQSRIDQQTTDWVATMVDAGAFEGETVGVLGFTDADEALYNETVAALRDVGVEPVEGLVPPAGGDVAANQASAGVIIEKFRAEGVTLTVHASPTAGGLEIAGNAGYETTWVQNPLIAPGVLKADGVDFSYIDGMLALAPTAVGTVDQPAMADDPAIAECVATIEDRSDEAIDFAIEPEVDNAITALNACGIATILELALTAAGPDLTNDSLGSALDGIGDFSMAGWGDASLGPDNYAAAGAGNLVRFSASANAWELEN